MFFIFVRVIFSWAGLVGTLSRNKEPMRLSNKSDRSELSASRARAQQRRPISRRLSSSLAATEHVHFLGLGPNSNFLFQRVVV